MAASTQKKFVLLINSAPFSREYFAELGRAFGEVGATVSYVLDSRVTDVLSGQGDNLPDSHYFTDFCQEWKRSGATLRPSSDLTWSSLLSDFDRFLTYGFTPPLTKSGSLGHGDLLALLEAFFEKTFDEIQPDAVVYEPISNSFAIAAYRAAKRRGIPFFSVQGGRIPGRYIEVSPTGSLRDHVALGDLLTKVLREGVRAETRQIAEDYIASIDNQTPDYMKKGGDGASLMAASLISKYANREKFDRFTRALRYRRTHREDMGLAYQVGDPLLVSWAMFRRQVKRRLRFRAVTKLFQAKVQGERYFLYPLHFHPEASTSVLAPDYIDEMSVIRAIAFRLPVGVKLVVKEHPSATALQPLSFYRDLAALPNVELVAPELNAKLLARKAIGVICITSTLGFEAALLNKPVVALGDVIYGYFPNVRMVEHFGDLDAALDWAMAYEPLDPERIVEAMAAYVEYLDEGAFSFKGSLQDPAAIDQVARVLLGKLSGPTGENAATLPGD
ncbi:hypothetical protein [Sphingomonas sp. KR3-1]|uniref:capsular polysaccharide export protein, LipB/KpsS family n=1 Tax=Sphingomonas sp. KR3-1 TaxID=3156611 RepID=UPI0032B4A18B